MAQDWNIKPRGKVCYKCEKPFDDQQECLSSLVYADSGYIRADYCSACWPEIERTTPFSTWKSIFRVPEEKPDNSLKKETAESLLRKLMEDNDNARINVIYILAIMLERKRILVERDVQTNETGELVRIYEHKESGETFLIIDPHLKFDELEPVQQEVMEMLGVSKNKNGNEQQDSNDDTPDYDDPPQETNNNDSAGNEK